MYIKLARQNKILLLCLLIAAFFLFKNLDNIYLWNDEANSALVAKNILKFGYPANFDGRNIVQHFWYYDGKLKLSPFYRTTTWLHLYLAALSFKLLGTNTFAARFPFAVIGLCVIIVLFLFLRKYEKDPFIINTAVILLTFCIPFYLHMRQCRYYSMATLFTLLGTWGYVEFYQQGRKTKFIVYSILLFLSMHSAYAILMLGVVVHFLLFYRRERIKELFVCWGWMSIVVVPVSVFLRLWERPVDLLGRESHFSFVKTITHFFGYVTYLNDYLVPFILVVVYLIWRLKRREMNLAIFKDNQPLTFMLVLLTVAILFQSIVAPHNFRFIVPYIPSTVILLSYMLRFFKERTHPYIAVLLIVVLISSNILHQSQYFLSFITKRRTVRNLLADVDRKLGIFRNKKFPNLNLSYINSRLWVNLNPTSFLYEYLYEITHDYDGPNEGICKYINQHAGKDDIVKATYGDFTYQFYTDLIVIPRGLFNNEIMPDWWIFRSGRWSHWFDVNLLEKYKAVLERDYEKIVLDYPEILWENLPEPEYHKFRTVKDAPRVIIYHRKEKAPPQTLGDPWKIKNPWKYDF
jgi:hypothetical protein